METTVLFSRIPNQGKVGNKAKRTVQGGGAEAGEGGRRAKALFFSNRNPTQEGWEQTIILKSNAARCREAAVAGLGAGGLRRDARRRQVRYAWKSSYHSRPVAKGAGLAWLRGPGWQHLHRQ